MNSIWVLVILVQFSWAIEIPTVSTKSGLIAGARLGTVTGKTVDRYLGIPFALPPVKHLRFRKPEPAVPWTGVFNATTQTRTCPQKFIPLVNHVAALEFLKPYAPMDEDCLKLNIWVPHNTTGKLPVMVWIYGGGFSRGAVNFSPYDGQFLSTEENVIVVTVNYRVASLGFLYLNHSEAPGNVGLWDQTMALQWIQDNIESFGGNSKEVTLFGQSAGASSIAYHQMSPVSKGLYKRVILESGGPDAHFAYEDPQRLKELSIQLAESLGCTTDPDKFEKMLDCLREADPNDVILSEPQEEYDNVYTFRPTIDKSFILAHPDQMMKEGKLNAVDMIAGTVKNEAASFMAGIAPFQFYFSETLKLDRQHLRRIGEDLLHYGDTFSKLQEIFYSDVSEKEDWKLLAAEVIDAISDYAFTCPLNKMVHANAKAGGKVFRFFFPHRSSNSLWPKWAGTVHVEDVFYVFGLPLDPKKNFNQDEVRFSKRVMRAFANFARTGDPNQGKDGQEPIEWPVFTPDEQAYLVLAPNSTQVGHRLRNRFCKLWDDVMPVLKTAESERLQRKAKNCV